MPPSALVAQAGVQDNQGVLSPGSRLWYAAGERRGPGKGLRVQEKRNFFVASNTGLCFFHMMPKVLIRQATYDYDMLKPRVFEILDSLGGGGIAPGTRVLLKPNFLSPAKPEDAVLTHPS